MKKDTTMMKVTKDSRAKIKIYSAMRNMTMQDYVEYLLELDEEKINEKENNLLHQIKEMK